MPYAEVAPEEVKARIARGEDVFLLDVREPDEVETWAYPIGVNIPLGQLGDRLDEVPRDVTVVVACHVGGRSAVAAKAKRPMSVFRSIRRGLLRFRIRGAQRQTGSSASPLTPTAGVRWRACTGMFFGPLGGSTQIWGQLGFARQTIAERMGRSVHPLI